MIPAKIIEEAGQLLTNLRNQLRPYSIGLSNVNKTGLRTMAQGREGYARLISQIASAHPNSLMREQDPGRLEQALGYDADLEKIRQSAMALDEMVTETQLANSVNIMRQVDAFAEALQLSRKGSEALDNAMGEIDEWNKRFGVKTGEEKTAETPTVE